MQYKKTILKNGIRLITVPMKGNPTVTVAATVNVGSRYEDEKDSGISHFLEHLHFKGTEKRSCKDLTLELDTLGADYNAFTNFEVTSYYAKSNKKYFNQILDIISDIYLNSNIPEEELEKERGVVIEEINMYEDNNQAKAFWSLRDLLYKNQPMGASILGTKENIKKLSREDFLNFKKEFYQGAATTVVVSGDISHTEIKKAVEEKFADLEKGKLKKPIKVKEAQKKPELKIENKKTDQSHMALGFRTFDIYNKDTRVLGMLRAVLSAGMSSRLFSIMREELGICYYCYAENSYSFDSGYLGIYAGVGNKRVDEAIEGINGILKDIKENGVSKKELDKVKKNIIGKMSMRLETSEQYADFFGEQEVMLEKIETPAQAIKKIKAVTPEQVQKMAQKIFKTENMNLSIVGPHKDAQKFKKLLKL